MRSSQICWWYSTSSVFSSIWPSLVVDVEQCVSSVGRWMTGNIGWNWTMCYLLVMKATAQLMCSFVLSWLDYCNSLLIDINCDQMYRLQKVQNHTAKVVYHKSRHEHGRLLLKGLHWLPIKERIIIKITAFVFRFCDGTLPPYVSSCLYVLLLGLSVPMVDHCSRDFTGCNSKKGLLSR